MVKERIAVIESDLNEITNLYDEAADRVNTHEEKLSRLFEWVRDLYRGFDDLGDEVRRLGGVVVEQRAQFDNLAKEFENLSIVDKPKRAHATEPDNLVPTITSSRVR